MDKVVSETDPLNNSIDLKTSNIYKNPCMKDEETLTDSLKPASPQKSSVIKGAIPEFKKLNKIVNINKSNAK